MATLEIERLGGFAGFGGPGSRLRSRGALRMEQLSPNDRQAVLALFAQPPRGAAQPDAFRYRLTLKDAQGTRTVEVGEGAVPQAVRDAVRDELG